MITINNDKAISITKDKIREYRKPKLEALDIEFQRALENGSDTSGIVAQKQELRDMTTMADGKSVDELKDILNNLGE